MQAIFNIAAIGLAALFGLAGGTGAMVALVELVQGGQGAGATLAGSVLMLMVAYWLWLRGGGRPFGAGQSKAAQAGLVAETQQFLDAVNSAGEFPVAQCDRVLVPPGEVVLAACNARMFLLRSSTRQQHIGTRVNVAGMPIYLGQSTPATSTELRAAAVGELALTNRSLIFSAPTKSDDFELSKLTSVEILKDGITLTIRGRKSPITFQLSNGLLWGQIVRNAQQLQLAGRKMPPGTQLRVM